jgi:energy-coupling factor transporter ATP-binding protein EcfA2
MPDEFPEVERIERQDFIREYFHYNAGEHVSFLGPTGSGKTTFAYQLLQEVSKPELQGIVFVMKPRDDTATKWNKELGYKRVSNWPPTMSIWDPKKPPGYTLWPKFTYKPRIDNAAHAEIFERCILDSYRKGNRILFADEVYGLSNEMGLGDELVAIWSRGRSMGCALWAATQKPTHVPLWMYSQATHLFLHNDPDERARKRFDEIGGVDPKLVRTVISKLAQHEWLYIHRNGPVMAIVSK